MSGVLKPGDRFGGRYLVESLIAEGGMASIYRARDEKLNRPVAVKVLYPYYGDNEVIRARFIEEGRIQQALGHPNVVLVHEVVEDPLAIVMEHVDGPTLDDYLAEQGQLREPEILEIVVPIMSALGLAHSKGIIHRDLKPSNILLNRLREGFQPKVMDFGVAKVKDAQHDLTATGTTVGTLHYMSPEQIVGSKNIDGRADIYSLGVTLYKLATGEVPFNAPTEFALMMAQVEAPPLPPSKLRPDLSPQLERVILKAMEKRPTDRFQTVRQLTTALLEMRHRGGESTVRDTITETISQELLEFAMAADEVAQDRTAEMNLHVITERFIEEVDGSDEPTMEIEATLRMQRRSSSFSQEPETLEGPTQESTQELSASQLIEISADEEFTGQEAVFGVDSNAATDIMQRRVDSDGSLRLDESSQRVTRPSRPVRPLDGPLDGTGNLVDGTGNLVSESVDTKSINRRIQLESDRVVVVDHDANSRDMTAPKVSAKEFQQAIQNSELPRPSGPKVVLGYNPADTQERTFEKPNYRTKLKQFQTAKSIGSDQPGRLGHDTPNPPPPDTNPDSGAPSRKSRSRPEPTRSSLMDQIDSFAQSAIDTAADHDLPGSFLVIASLLLFTILACCILLLGYYLLG